MEKYHAQCYQYGKVIPLLSNPAGSKWRNKMNVPLSTQLNLTQNHVSTSQGHHQASIRTF